MPVRKVGHTALGLFNQSNPLWELGAWMYWNPSMGAKAQMQGGAFAPADFAYTYAGAQDYTHWDPGKGAYVVVDGASPVPPLDGHFAPARTNTFDNNDPALNTFRGAWTVTGLVRSVLTPPVSPHIVVLKTGLEPPDVILVSNFTGSAERMNVVEDSHGTLKSMFSMLVKRSDGGVVNSSTCKLGMSALVGGADAGLGTTRYTKIREDGWYQLSRSFMATIIPVATVFFLEVEPGITNLTFEAPFIERWGTTIEEPTAPVFSPAGVSRSRDTHDIVLSGSFDLPYSGWMGATIIPRTDWPDWSTYLFAEIFSWRVGVNDRHRFMTSSSADTLVYWAQESGVTQAFLDVPQAKVLQGVPIGIVATWGARNGTNSYMMAVNGEQEDIIDTGDPIPTGAGDIYIGSQNGSSVANVQLQHAALGNRMLTRHEVRYLSRWFQTAANGNLGIKGA